MKANMGKENEKIRLAIGSAARGYCGLGSVAV